MATGEHNDYVPQGMLGLLFIEPKNDKSEKPIIDILTRKITAAFHQSNTNRINSWCGHHCCKCSAYSDASDYAIDNFVTNSLCIHYIAYHRSEVPETELAKVAALNYGEQEPTEKELYNGNPPKNPKAHLLKRRPKGAGSDWVAKIKEEINK